MRFDCCIGNPPYQSSSNVTSIYQLFLNQMLDLTRDDMTAIVPAKWNYSVQSGMAELKKKLLTDGKIDTVHYYQDAQSSHVTCIFPEASTREIVYFNAKKKKKSGVCRIVEHDINGDVYRDEVRDIFTYGTGTIIFNRMLSDIMKKIYKTPNYVSIQPEICVINNDEDSELETNAFDMHPEYYSETPLTPTDVKIYAKNYKTMYIARDKVKHSDEYLTHYHALISSGFFNCILLEPGCSCNRSHVIYGDFENKEYAQNAVDYFKTKFFQFISQTGKGSNRVSYHAMKLMPAQDFSIKWTDEMLFEKYHLNSEEREYVLSEVWKR